jgi:hypothetical protein
MSNGFSFMFEFTGGGHCGLRLGFSKAMAKANTIKDDKPARRSMNPSSLALGLGAAPKLPPATVTMLDARTITSLLLIASPFVVARGWL